MGSILRELEGSVGRAPALHAGGQGARVSYSPLEGIQKVCILETAPSFNPLSISAVERLTVNQLVPGLIPGRGVMYRFVVVGGGTAGAMTATYLKSYWGDKVDVTVVYDHKKPNIGLGKVSPPQFLLT